MTDAIAEAVPVFVSLWEWPDPPEPAAVGGWSTPEQPVLGLNCQPGASAAIAFAERIGQIDERPAAREAGRRHAVPSEAMSPADLAAAVPGLLEHNVRLIGGCCGTNEQHVGGGGCLRAHFIVYPLDT